MNATRSPQKPYWPSPSPWKRIQILTAICANDVPEIKATVVNNWDMNFRHEYLPAGLDDLITPLTAACFLGKLEIVKTLLESQGISINLPTSPALFYPLTAACISGYYEIMQLLLENGAEVDAKNCAGQTALAYCFARLDETENFFENKNLCIKMTKLLLQYGADINVLVNETDGLTLLMQFCGLDIELTPLQAEANLEIIKFLLEHGADRQRKTKKGEKAWDLTQASPQREEIRKLLKETKQKYFYSTGHKVTTLTDTATENIKNVNEIQIESRPVTCGCCTHWFK